MIFYQMVFVLLITEMVIFVLLVVPFPQSFRNAVVRWVSNSQLIAQSMFLLKVAFFFIALLFLDSIHRMIRAQNEVMAEKSHHHHHDAGSEALLRSKMFYAQRNMYLTGFTLFLSLILNRFYYLICDVIKNEEKYQSLLKQSKDSSKLKPTNEALQSYYDHLKKEFDIVKKQATQNEKEYMALSDRYNALEKKYTALVHPDQKEASGSKKTM